MEEELTPLVRVETRGRKRGLAKVQLRPYIPKAIDDFLREYAEDELITYPQLINWILKDFVVKKQREKKRIQKEQSEVFIEM